MLGLILCGGQSQRMGSDKGLMKTGDKTWAQTAADKLYALNIPVKISLNEKQLPFYGEVFSLSKLIVDDTSLFVKGPLLGILSCHLAFPDEDIFVLACDMLAMETSVILSLCTNYQQQHAEAYIFTNDGEAEPLCGIYTAKGLSVILELLNKGLFVKQSMKCILEHLTVAKIALQEEEKKYFRNFNTASEISE